MLGVVRLPDSAALTTAICQLSTKDCLVQTHIEDPAAQIRVGVFATDLSYWQFCACPPAALLARVVGCNGRVSAQNVATRKQSASRATRASRAASSAQAERSVLTRPLRGQTSGTRG